MAVANYKTELVCRNMIRQNSKQDVEDKTNYNDEDAPTIKTLFTAVAILINEGASPRWIGGQAAGWRRGCDCAIACLAIRSNHRGASINRLTDRR
jgi:hypothetical protein